MHKLFTSSFDASIYLQQPEQNAGRDEILEVGKLYYGSTMDIARTLIKFPITQVSEVVLEESASLNSLLNSNSASVSTISSSWYTAVSSSLYWSSSYKTISQSLSALSNYSESYSNLVDVYTNASESVYNLESNLTYVNEIGYLTISASYAALFSSSITSSIVDLELSSSYNQISSSYYSYIIQSSSLYNQKSELTILNNRLQNYNSNNLQSASLYISANDASSSWSNYVTQSLVVSASYNLESASLALDILNGEYVFNYKTYLNLKSANSEEIPLEYTLYANAVSQSWNMGTGTKFDNITSNGVSWYYKNGIDKWMDYVVTPNSYVSGSDTGSISNGGGGTWYTASMASQSYSYEDADIRMNVTGIVNLWLSGSISNNGFILHHSLTAENNELDYGVLKFFSKETNTIYEPKLEVVSNDSLFVTGSLTSVTGSAQEGYKVVLTNLKSTYPANETIKVRVKGRDMYPLKTFGTGSFAYDQNKYLPSGSSYYQLEDYKTGEVIYPFGQYTQISCDSTSNYFNMSLNSLPINRTYELKIKIIESGISTIIDDKLIFEIE